MGIASSSQTVLRASHARFLFEAAENISRDVLNRALYKLGEQRDLFCFPVLSQRQADVVQVLNF